VLSQINLPPGITFHVQGPAGTTKPAEEPVEIDKHVQGSSDIDKDDQKIQGTGPPVQVPEQISQPVQVDLNTVVSPSGPADSDETVQESAVTNEDTQQSDSTAGIIEGLEAYSLQDWVKAFNLQSIRSLLSTWV